MRMEWYFFQNVASFYVLMLRETEDDRDLLAGKSGPCISSSPQSHVYFEHQQHPQFTGPGCSVRPVPGRDIEQQKSYFVTRCNTGLWEEALLSVKVKIWKLIWGPAFHLCQGVLMKYKYCTHPELGPGTNGSTLWCVDIVTLAWQRIPDTSHVTLCHAARGKLGHIQPGILIRSDRAPFCFTTLFHVNFKSPF